MICCGQWCIICITLLKLNFKDKNFRVGRAILALLFKEQGLNNLLAISPQPLSMAEEGSWGKLIRLHS